METCPTGWISTLAIGLGDRFLARGATLGEFPSTSRHLRYADQEDSPVLEVLRANSAKAAETGDLVTVTERVH